MPDPQEQVATPAPMPPQAQPQAQPQPSASLQGPLGMMTPRPQPMPQAKPAKPEYTDPVIELWRSTAKKPMARQMGLQAVFDQKIKSRQSRMEGWLERVQQGYPLEKIPAKDRGYVETMIHDRGITPETFNLKPEYVAGLRILHNSLVGDTNTPGLLQSLKVLDSKSSRLKIAMVPELMQAHNDPAGMISQLFTMYKSSFLNADEKMFIKQMARALSAINSLRSVTGLPRSTQQLMHQYMLELPNVVMDSSAEEGYQRLQLIHREIASALRQGQRDQMMSLPPLPGSEGEPISLPNGVSPADAGWEPVK